MKTLTSAALTEIAKQYGTEPLTLVEISGSVIYSSRAVLGYKPKIIGLGQIQTLLTSDNRQSQSIKLTLDDTDGEIKEILNTVDIHKVPCTIYQFYKGLAATDAFTLFQGRINAPYTWSESGRSVEFEVLSEIESYEVGFSPEEGQLNFVNLDFIGKPWPLSFGAVTYSLCQKVHQTLTGTLQEAIGIVDPMLDWKIELLMIQYNDVATLFGFNQMLMTGANAIAPPVAEIETTFVRLINESHIKLAEIERILKELDHRKAAFKKNPDRALGNQIAPVERQLADKSNEVAQVASKLNDTLINIDLAVFEYEIKKEAALTQIKAYNDMCDILTQVQLINQEKCRQAKLEKDYFNILDGEFFPQGQTVEISVNGLNYRGTFTGNLFHRQVGPYSKYQNVRVAPWVRDLDPCQPSDQFNGIATFYLKDSPPQSLVGQYLLVQKKGATVQPSFTGIELPERHIIKVVRQSGQKVVFELIPWNVAQSSGQPSGLDINKVLGEVNQWSLTGDAPTDLLQRPEFVKLIQVIISIMQYSKDNDLSIPPTKEQLDDVFKGLGLNEIINVNERWAAYLETYNSLKQYWGVNAQQLTYLAKLVFIEQSDQLSDSILIDIPTKRQMFTIIGEDISHVQQSAATVLREWLDNYAITLEEIPDSAAWTADFGSNVRQGTDDCEIYVANILPSTIHAVHAYRQRRVDGKRVLAPVPSSYYTKQENANLGTINVTALVFPRALKDIDGENWEDDIYVTMTSSVGPNICDIIEWLLTTYVPGSVCHFTSQHSKYTNYPAGFTLYDRPDALDEVSRIAWESRSALIRSGHDWYIKYLSEEPTEDVTFTLADIETESLTVTHSDTESLVTRFIARYNLNSLPLLGHHLQPKWVIRNNVKKYGLHTREEYFHIYNIPELVLKSATFWAIRLSYTWKQVSFKTVLKNIRLDTLDTILFDLGKTFFTNDPVKGVITSASYDPKDKSIDVVAWLPIRSGEMIPYIWAWPASQTESFPPSVEIALGYSGGYGPGSGVKGTIPGC